MKGSLKFTNKQSLLKTKVRTEKHVFHMLFFYYDNTQSHIINAKKKKDVSFLAHRKQIESSRCCC